jgi:5-methylcytosine-specific restriction enzyme subunit McrC
MNLILLFEQNTTDFPDGFDETEWKKTVKQIWEERYSFDLESDFWDNGETKLWNGQILDFLRGEKLKTGKHCGVIATEEEQISILPKVFRGLEKSEEAQADPSLLMRQVHSHLLWWLSYASKLRFPKSFSSFSSQNSDLLEILIYFYAYYTEEQLNSYVYNDYHLTEDDLSVVRGRIKFNDYAAHASRGNWHIVPCEYSEYQYDNELNQIIKYVTNLLIDQTKEPKTNKLLDNILDQLSGVTYHKFEAEDCDHILLNPLFEEYHIVLDYCKMFLSSTMVSSASNKLTVFSFLIEMSWVYENFLMEFIRNNKKVLGVKKIKKGGGVLATDLKTGENRFNVEFDFEILMEDDTIVLADAKYKWIYREIDGRNRSSNNYGIKSGDVYQMTAYSHLCNTRNIHLFYPKYYDHGPEELKHAFKINDKSGVSPFDLTAEGLDICNYNIGEFKEEKKLSEYFEQTEKNLLKQLKQILNP